MARVKQDTIEALKAAAEKEGWSYRAPSVPEGTHKFTKTNYATVPTKRRLDSPTHKEPIELTIKVVLNNPQKSIAAAQRIRVNPSIGSTTTISLGLLDKYKKEQIIDWFGAKERL